MSVKRHNASSRAPEDLLAAQNRVLEMIALGNPLEEVLRELTSLVDRQVPEGRSCICLIDAEGPTLRPAASSRLPPEILREISAMPVGPRCGACGTAAYRGQRVV